ncbi:MAG: YitT family protein [Clostridiales bacterium]|nr:YitT family protein [Clostridiales bacterium]
MGKAANFTQHRIWHIFLDVLAFICGSALYAAGVVIFINPNQISSGGVTGIALIIHSLAPIPIGLTVLVLNIPLFIIGYIKLGWRFIGRTAVCTVLMSVTLDVFGSLLPAYTGNRILAALFGGVFMGAGLALVLLRGATTGGTDIAAKLVNGKWPHLSMGRVILIVDTIILLTAALVYWDIETALYSAVAIFASSRIIDSLLYGADKGKLIFIVTEKPGEVADGIFQQARRGVTAIRAEGAYTKAQRTMLLCAVRQNEVAAVRRASIAADRSAFIVVTEAGEVVGEGFKRPDA